MGRREISRILEFLEVQLFDIDSTLAPIEDQTCHLTYDMWSDLRREIEEGLDYE